MTTGNDLRRQFPKAEDGFRRAVDNALDSLEEDRVGHAFHVPRLVAVLAIALLLLSSAAVAATVHRLNIQDFTDRSDKANLTDAARLALAADFPDVVIDNPYADVVITEAVYDGLAVYLLVEAKSMMDGAFIVPSHMFEGNQAVSFGSSYPKDMSIGQYAEQLGYQRVMSMQGWIPETSGQYYDSELNEDGSFSLMMWGLVRPEYRMLSELNVEMTISVEMDGNRIDELTAAFSIPLAGSIETAGSRADESVIFENAGVCIKGIELIGTPMGTYIIANYDIVNRTKYGQYITYRQFRFLDEKGQEPPKGAYPLSMRFDASYYRMGEQPFYITNRIYDEMPAQITIGEYDGNREDGWTNGKTYTFQLE